MAKRKLKYDLKDVKEKLPPLDKVGQLHWEAAVWAKAYVKKIAKKATKEHAMTELADIVNQFGLTCRACEEVGAEIRHVRSVLQTVATELAEAEAACERARVAAMRRSAEKGGLAELLGSLSLPPQK